MNDKRNRKKIFVDFDNTLYYPNFYAFIFELCGESKLSRIVCVAKYTILRLTPSPLREKLVNMLYQIDYHSLESRVSSLRYNEKLIEKLKEYKAKGYEILSFTAEPREVVAKIVDYIKKEHNLEVKPAIYSSKERFIFTLKEKLDLLRKRHGLKKDEYLIIEDKCSDKHENCYRPEEFTD